VYHDYGGKAEVYSRTHHMLLSVWGSRWRKVELIMFTLYIDDSGTDPNQQVAIATALKIPGRQIERLEREWDAFRKKEGFRCFHTSEFMARNPKSDFANWDDGKQERVFRRVRQIAQKYGLGALSFAVKKKDYDELVPEDFRRYFGRYHYTWAIRQLISYVGKWYEEQNGTIPFEFLFQWMGGPSDKRRREVETVMEQAQWLSERRKVPGDYSNYGFRKSTDIPGLQCVDAVAWVSYRYALYVFCKTPLPKFALESWEDFGGPKGESGWLSALTIMRDKLQNTVDMSIKTGKTKEFFKEWEEYKRTNASPP
jgi:Protein of unknown function (DUF3800)